MDLIDKYWKQAMSELQPTEDELRCLACYERYLDRVARRVEELKRGGPMTPEQQALVEYENAPY